jgi:hypothetical protein
MECTRTATVQFLVEHRAREMVTVTLSSGALTGFFVAVEGSVAQYQVGDRRVQLDLADMKSILITAGGQPTLIAFEEVDRAG